MDSSDIGYLLLTAQGLHQRGGRLICHAVPAHLIRVLEVTGWADTPASTLAPTHQLARPSGAGP